MEHEMNDNRRYVRQYPAHGAIAGGADSDNGPDPRDSTGGWEIGTEYTIRHVVAGCIARPLTAHGKARRQAIEFELVTTDAGLRYRERLPSDPVDPSWAYLARKGLAAHYLRKRADFIAEGSWQMTDTTKADDLLVAMARSEAAGRG